MSFEDNSEQISVSSGASFQIQLMRCGFLPQNSISSFDVKDLKDLDLNDESLGDNHPAEEDHSPKSRSSTGSARIRSMSPVPASNNKRRGGLRATLSFRLSRRNLLDSSNDDLESASLHHREPRGSKKSRELPARRGVQRTYSASKATPARQGSL
ncbi:expressed unknown protein [Seminavis robusta]|uniref:Uncharacterized protein n=1 Tax=Seminavis robusta TaxID=568900 RepID=A0A9N8E6M8_9STRA|nr:expressed unknown protein [Seminavis robusta]|eukprot:Sro730_g194090.1 n/a (155) ;mRNA; f:36671-37135